ncbi:MAG: carboxypeptidase regulatory-like domain-containing protein [Bryobacterales bacterium]|nr:carboxypeptidase regulatory-like domain-containing protein [Bryobacterales bacterium]
MSARTISTTIRSAAAFAACWVVVASVPFLAHAQTDQATLRGNALDPTGAAIPDVTVTLVSATTGITRSTKTGATGTYEIPYIVPGGYRLTAEAPGFKTFIATDIAMSARETRRLDITLELGTVGTEVTVSAGAAVIATEGSQIAGGFQQDAYVNSPLSQSFFPQAYMTTLPNIQTNMGGWGLRFAGQPSNQTVQSMDGVPNDGVLNLVNNMQDFEELQVVAVNNSAEYSRVANFTMAGRQGTNEFHGRVYYDVNNSALNARRFFDPRRIPFKRHQAGFNVNGPVIRNKTFFYFGYSLNRIPSSTFFNRNVAPDAFRDGDFSQLLQQATPRQLLDPLSGQPFANNQIPRSRFNSISQRVQDNFIPRPNQGAPGLRQNNYGFTHPWPTDILKWDSITARIDHNFGEKNQLFGRFINRLTPYVLAGSFPNVGTWTRERDHHSIVISDTHMFSPNLINTFRWGWIKDYFIDGTTVDGFTPVTGDQVVQDLGLQGVNPQGFSAMGFPRMDIVGLTTLRQQPGGVNLDRNDFAYANSTTWTTGSHVVKFGVDLRTFNDFNGGIPEGNYGSFNFNGSLTGEGYADFLLGLPFSSTRLDPFTNRTRTAYELGLYLTDTFKVSRKLTLDYGLRWDYFGASKYKDQRQFNWDRATGDVVVPQEVLGVISPLYPSTINVRGGDPIPRSARDNIRPRIGVAYRLRDDFVLRGGFGAYTETLGNFARIQTGGPFQIAETYFNEIVGGQPSLSFPNPFPTSLAGAAIPSQSIAGFPDQTDNGVIYQFNVSLEKQFGSLGTRMSYIGSRSRGINYNLSINKPEPSLIPFTQSRRPFNQFVNINYALNDGRANYDSFQIELTKKMGMFTFNGHYTLANNMADNLNLQNPYDYKFWNRDAFTSRNRAVITTNWEIPVGRGKMFMADAPRGIDLVLGGWQMSTISYFQSGQYFSPSFTGADPSRTNTFGGLPDRVGDGNLPRGDRDISRWFDASAFVAPPAGRFGNSGVNVLQGPGMNLHHLSLIKEFALTERVMFNFQGMFSNVFNTPHFAFPNTNITVPGQVSRIGAMMGGDGGRERSASREILGRFRIDF